MNVYRINCDVDRFREFDILDDDMVKKVSKGIDGDIPLLKQWSPVVLEWSSWGTRRKLPQITDANGITGLALRSMAVPFFRQFTPKCCELLPAHLGSEEEAY